MKLSWRHFINFSFLLELFLYGFSFLLAISLAINLATKQIAEVAVSTSNYDSAWQFIISFIIASAILFLLLKYFKKPWLIQAIFYLAILEGLYFYTSAYFPWPNFLYILGFLVIVWRFYNNVFMHNLVLILAMSAIAVFFGANLQPSETIIILLILAAYDFWAVYKTKHMVSMFRGMAEAKVHFSLIIPFAYRGLFKKIGEVSMQTEFMFLGTGDLAIPAIFVISSLKISLLTGLVTALGAIGGFILLHLLFVTQKERAPMPGLPPIILGTLIGYLISFFI